MLSEIHIRNENIPLFNTIALETSAVCNRHCSFCPVVKGDRPDEEMPKELWDKAVDELVALKYKGRITPYIYNEPMRDPRLLELLTELKEKLPKACVMISTNGDYIKRPEQIDDLYKAGVRQLIINVYSKEKRHKHLSEMIKEVKTPLDLNSSMYTYAKAGETRFQLLRKFDKNNFEGGFMVQNRSGNIPDYLPALKEPLKKMCVRPWRFLNVNWTGQGILCCNDYHGETNFGNLKDNTLLEIWNNMAFHGYREKLQQKVRTGLCKTCDYNGGSYPHMIHPVVLEK